MIATEMRKQNFALPAVNTNGVAITVSPRSLFFTSQWTGYLPDVLIFVCQWSKNVKPEATACWACWSFHHFFRTEVEQRGMYLKHITLDRHTLLRVQKH